MRINTGPFVAAAQQGANILQTGLNNIAVSYLQGIEQQRLREQQEIENKRAQAQLNIAQATFNAQQLEQVRTQAFGRMIAGMPSEQLMSDEGQALIARAAAQWGMDPAVISTWAKMAEPDLTTAQRNALAMGLTPGTPEYNAAIANMGGPASTTVDVNVGIPGSQPTKATTSKLQDQLGSDIQLYNQAVNVEASFDARYFTGLGKVRAKLLGGRDKWLNTGGILPFLDSLTGLDEDQKAFVAGYRDIYIQVEQMFNQYRKDITGAAAAMQELEMLRNAFVNMDLGPVEAQQALRTYKDTIAIGSALKTHILSKGFAHDPAENSEFSKQFVSMMPRAKFKILAVNTGPGQAGERYVMIDDVAYGPFN